MRFSNKIIKFIHYFEYVIAGMLIIALFASLIRLSIWLYNTLMHHSMDAAWLSTFLVYVFSIVIGLEFLKMLVRQTSGSVMEVLLFAIARQMIVEHSTPFENLLCVVSITILFIARKYFYVSKFDVKYNGQGEQEKTEKLEKDESDGKP